MEEQAVLDIKIDVDKAISRLELVNRSMTELKSLNRQLAAEMKKSGDATGELSAKMAANNKEIELLKGEQKGLISQLQTQEKYNFSLGDSYEQINAQVKQLQKEYRGLTEEQRNSAGGQALLKQLNEQKDKLKEIDATMGDHFRNVGNYPQVMSGAFGKIDTYLGKFGTSVATLIDGGLGGLKTALSATGKAVVSFGKTLLTSPLGVILLAVTALVKIFDKLKEAFAKNDTAGTNLAVALDSLKPITVLLRKAFDGLALILSKLALGIGEVITAIGGLVPGYAEAAEAAQELTKAEDNLEEQERQYAVESAKRSAEASELNAKALDKEKYSAAEREEMLKKAIDLETQNLEDEKKIKAEHLRILEERAKQDSDTSDETANKIAEARAAMYQAEEAYNNGTRRLQSKLLDAQKEQRAEEQKIIDERIAKQREAQEEEKRIQAERLALYNEITKEIEDAVLENMEEGTEKQKAEENLRWEREKEDLKAKYEGNIELKEQYDKLLEEKEKTHKANLQTIQDEADAAALEAQQMHRERMDALDAELQALEDEKHAGDFAYKQQREQEEFDAEIERMREEWAMKKDVTEEEQKTFEDLITEKQKAYDAQKLKAQQEYEDKAKQQRMANATAQVNAFSNIMGSVSDLIAAFDDESEESAKAQKALALGQIAVQTGIAIAQGIATATRSSATWIDQLVAIATTVTTVVANMASAISTVKSAKFAEGGIVDGTSFTGDKLQVNVNSGEMILNKEQQAQLFDIANGRSNAGGIDYEALALAVANTPAPIMDYKEFTDFQAKTAQYNEIARL